METAKFDEGAAKLFGPTNTGQPREYREFVVEGARVVCNGWSAEWLEFVGATSVETYEETVMFQQSPHADVGEGVIVEGTFVPDVGQQDLDVTNFTYCLELVPADE